MKKICIIGAPSSGKSTLTHGIFSALKKQGINTEIVHEWIRSDIWQNGPMMSIWEQYRTRNHQKELEDSVPNVDCLISDAGTLSMYFFAVRYFKESNTRERLILQDLYKYLLDDIYLKRYDLIFYLPVQDVDFNDGTRYQTKDDIMAIDDHMNIAFNSLYKTDFIHCLNGPMDCRHDMAIKIIDELFEK